jgi:hypothetical protein
MTNTQSRVKCSPTCMMGRASLQLPTWSSHATRNPSTTAEVSETITKELTQIIIGYLLNKKIENKNHMLPKNEYTKVIALYKDVHTGLAYSSLKNTLSGIASTTSSTSSHEPQLSLILLINRLLIPIHQHPPIHLNLQQVLILHLISVQAWVLQS